MLALGDIIGVRVKHRSSFSEDDEEEGDEGSESEEEEESNHETNDLVYFTVCVKSWVHCCANNAVLS